ncbi:MAG: hypothetical protein H3Z50_03415 [archaeon]|nr:hypothetical protein [archaeon]
MSKTKKKSKNQGLTRGKVVGALIIIFALVYSIPTILVLTGVGLSPLYALGLGFLVWPIVLIHQSLLCLGFLIIGIAIYKAG